LCLARVSESSAFGAFGGIAWGVDWVRLKSNVRLWEIRIPSVRCEGGNTRIHIYILFCVNTFLQNSA
jgi:hypothetical protein